MTQKWNPDANLPSFPTPPPAPPVAPATPTPRWRELLSAASDLVQNRGSHDGPCQDPVLVADNGCDFHRQAFERRWLRLSAAVMDIDMEEGQ